MTDKQITNEIDVSKCEFCSDSGYCYIYSGTADFKWTCKENEDCQIKNLLLQLKSKEQECQQAMDNYVQLDLKRVKEYNELVDLYKAKEQECEELKKELQAQRAFTAHEQKLIYCVAYDESCKTGNDCKQEKCIFKDNIKLKQTLTEIKEIAEKTLNMVDYKTYFKRDNKSLKQEGFKALNEILQKISECEVENDNK